MPRQRLRAERGRGPVLRPGSAAGPPGRDTDASHESEPRAGAKRIEGWPARVSVRRRAGGRVPPRLGRV